MTVFHYRFGCVHGGRDLGTHFSSTGVNGLDWKSWNIYVDDFGAAINGVYKKHYRVFNVAIVVAFNC